MVRSTNVLSPLPVVQARKAQEVRHVETLGGKTVGFLSGFWPPYKPLVEELTDHLRQKYEVGDTPRADYYGRPPLKSIWAEQEDWVQQLDGAVVGIGA